MDKQKIKIILIAVAVLLAIFLLYRTFSRISDNKTAAAGKIDSANADLTIKQNQDAYIASRENQKKTDEEKKVDMINDAQTAEGHVALDEYMDTLSDSQRELYKSMRSDYIRVMGVDPGVMSFPDLQKWSETYAVWSELNDRHLELTGQSKSFLDPDFDTVDEMKAALLTAESDIKTQWDRAWQDAYDEFYYGNESLNLKGCGDSGISLSTFQKWLDNPQLINEVQKDMVSAYNSYTTKKLLKVTAAYNTLVSYFNEKRYIHNRSGNGEWKHVRGCNDISDALYQELNSFNVNDFALMTYWLRRDGGVTVYTAVNWNNSVDKDSKIVCTNFYDAALAVASFYYSYKESTNILGAIASLGISAAIQKNNKVLNYVPAHLNTLLRRIELGGQQTYTLYGWTKETIDWFVSGYSQRYYGFGDWWYSSIESGNNTLEEFLQSDQYTKNILK